MPCWILTLKITFTVPISVYLCEVNTLWVSVRHDLENYIVYVPQIQESVFLWIVNKLCVISHIILSTVIHWIDRCIRLVANWS